MTEDTMVIPAVGQLPRWSGWSGVLPVVESRPDSSNLPGRPTQDTAFDDRPSLEFMERVLDALYRL